MKKIDEQLKVITRKLKDEADEIESIAAPYHQFEYKYQDCIHFLVKKKKKLILF